MDNQAEVGAMKTEDTVFKGRYPSAQGEPPSSLTPAGMPQKCPLGQVTEGGRARTFLRVLEYI